jgi:hypothetical protein
VKDFTLFFGGAEQQGWRRLLAEQDAAMSLSFRGLLRRMPKTKPYLLADRLAGEYPLLLDSGAHSFNAAKSTPDRQELLDFAQRYETFVEANTDRPTLITEFDSVHLGLDWIVSRREAFYDHLEPAKFMPVWHAEWGIPTLKAMAAKYEVIALMATETVTGSNLSPVLQQIARSGVRLHGVALTKPDVLRVLPLNSAASTSWLSPAQFGDTIVWDGQQLRRYPRDYKDQARRQHKMLMERAGFDADLIVAGDATETLRFTIWSWLQQADAIRSMRRRVNGEPVTVSDGVTVPSDPQLEGVNGSNGAGGTVTDLAPRLNSAPERERLDPPEERERQVMPVLGVRTVTSKDTDADGNEIEHSTDFMTVSNTSSRRCDHCYIADVCVDFRPGYVCAYDIPVSAETAEQRKAIMTGVIKMQTQRVAFLKLAEDRNGGYADPNLSSEMDRLSKLMLAQHEIEDDRDTFEMTMRAKGARVTMLDRIFGAEAPPRHGQVVDVDPVRAIEQKVPLH